MTQTRQKKASPEHDACARGEDHRPALGRHERRARTAEPKTTARKAWPAQHGAHRRTTTARGKIELLELREKHQTQLNPHEKTTPPMSPKRAARPAAPKRDAKEGQP